MKAIVYSKKYQRWLTFCEPLVVLRADSPDQVAEVIARCEKANQSQGLWSVGFVCYDSASGFDSDLRVRERDGELPYAVFGVFNEPEYVSKLTTNYTGSSTDIQWAAEIEKKRYLADLEYIRQRLSEGDTYQVNYTFRLNADYHGSPEQLFYLLSQMQPTSYGAFVELDDFAICSASPELFFSREGTILTARPMKGTAPRGLDRQRDQIAANELFNSEKARAENVMIVDMVRNDMGRIAEPGSVSVPKLFTIEQYPTLWQMTSTVTCTSHASLKEIFTALFPCASITGAPKRAAMNIIAELEASPRGVYCGAIGLVDEDGDCCFNVAIRTVTIDKRNHKASYGSGGGIVWDSCPHDEFEEAALKASMLTRPLLPDFQLLETMAYYPNNGYLLLLEHLERICSSADYFGYNIDIENIKKELDSMISSFSGPKRIRLLSGKSGKFEIQCFDLAANPESPARVALAARPVDSSNVFLYHKTTCREVYTEAINATPGYDDILLYNQNNEVTESTIANIVVEIGGVKYTPPVICGLLPGTYRNYLLNNSEISEKAITIDMLRNADAIYLINSVRKWRKAVLVDNPIR